MKNRRKHFLIDKPLQIRYLVYIVLTLSIVSAVGMIGSYYGIWASAMKAFSEESIRESLVTAAQINEYDKARHGFKNSPTSNSSLRSFQETALLSERQQEIIQEIMNETNRRMLALGIVLLFFIGWGSVFLTHKIAGPVLKLRQYLYKLEQGDLTTRIKLRQFDEIHNLAESFNAMSATLDAQIGKIKRVAKENETVSEELKKELAKFKTSAG